MQEAGLFSDDKLSTIINQEFYALKVDAEDKTDFFFFGRIYKGATSSQYHELATYIGSSNEENLNFPTTIILSKEFELIYKKAALVNKEDFMKLVNNLFY